MLLVHDDPGDILSQNSDIFRSRVLTDIKISIVLFRLSITVILLFSLSFFHGWPSPVFLGFFLLLLLLGIQENPIHLVPMGINVLLFHLFSLHFDLRLLLDYFHSLNSCHRLHFNFIFDTVVLWFDKLLGPFAKNYFFCLGEKCIFLYP